MGQGAVLEGRRVLVTGGERAFGRALGSGLAAAGAETRSVELPDADRSSIRAICDEAVAALGGIDAFVHAHHDPDLLVPKSLLDTPEGEWELRCEAVLQRALFALQAAHAHLCASGGRIVLVIPTLSTAGAAGLVPLATAYEAVRVLGKTAAKQWGRHGITVNTLAPGLEALAEGGDVARVALGAPALPDFDASRDVGPIVSFLASDAAAHLTGATLRVDGGTWTPG